MSGSATIGASDTAGPAHEIEQLRPEDLTLPAQGHREVLSTRPEDLMA